MITTIRANAHNLKDIALLFNNIASNTNEVIANALMQEMLCPDIKKYPKVKIIATIAEGFLKSYCPSPNGININWITKKTNNAIMLMCIPDIDKK